MFGPPTSGNVRGPRGVVIIPARWGSTRFPGKVLASLAGRSMLSRVCDVAVRAASLSPVIEAVVVATDDARIASHATERGIEVRMTSPEHASGTDRVAEVARTLEAEIVVGLQADEPFLAAEDLVTLTSALSASKDDATPSPPPADVSTLSIPLTSREQWFDPNVVKVVTDVHGRALYFSRSPIPYRATAPFTLPPQGDPPTEARVHVGVYAWRREALEQFASRSPSALERLERLEQLRVLEAGGSIQVCEARSEPMGIDTPEDLRRAERRLSERPVDNA